MGSFPRPGTRDTRDTHSASATIHVAARSKDYRTAFAASPVTTQIAYRMWKACTHACCAKITDHVADFQEAINNPIVLCLNGSFKICCVHRAHIYTERAFSGCSVFHNYYAHTW